MQGLRDALLNFWIQVEIDSYEKTTTIWLQLLFFNYRLRRRPLTVAISDFKSDNCLWVLLSAPELILSTSTFTLDRLLWRSLTDCFMFLSSSSIESSILFFFLPNKNGAMNFYNHKMYTYSSRLKTYLIKFVHYICCKTKNGHIMYKFPYSIK